MNINEKFVFALRDLSAVHPEQVIGVAKLLGVKLTAEEDPNYKVKEGALPLRPAQEIVGDIIYEYARLGREKRRQLLKMVRECAKDKAPKPNGTSSKD